MANVNAGQLCSIVVMEKGDKIKTLRRKKGEKMKKVANEKRGKEEDRQLARLG